MEKLTAQRTNLIAWKTGLTNEIKVLEKNINQLYEVVGIKVNNVVEFETDTTAPEIGISKQHTNYNDFVEECLSAATKATSNICTLIGAKTEFDLPIPVYVLLRLAAKVGLIRCKDHKKIPNELTRQLVYSKSSNLIDLSSLLFRVVLSCLGTNIIPFTPFIASTLITTLEWTRTSSLEAYNEKQYHLVRSQILSTLAFILELLSLNANFEPGQLRVLLEIELMSVMDNLVDSPEREAEMAPYKDEHIVSICKCLGQLILVYGSLLEVKSYIVKCCLKIYRDFESNTVRPKCRRELLDLLRIVANQPYATSTTEMAYHIFELAGRLDDEVEVRCLARQILSLGMTHRPTIVSHFEVQSCHGHPIKLSAELNAIEQEHSQDQTNGELESEQRLEQIEAPVEQQEDGLLQAEHPRTERDQSETEKQPPRQEEQVSEQAHLQLQQSHRQQEEPSQGKDPPQQQDQQQQQQGLMQTIQHKSNDRHQGELTPTKKRQEPSEGQQEQQEQPNAPAPASDTEVQYYMNFFVEKLASPRSIT